MQEACLRAYQYFGGFHGGSARAWLLTIVRNTCYTWLERNRARQPTAVFDEEKHSGTSPGASAEGLAQQNEAQQLIGEALDALPPEYREVLVLRELEGMSYKEVAKVAGLPLGTVMSRLSRARQRLQQALGGPTEQGVAR